MGANYNKEGEFFPIINGVLYSDGSVDNYVICTDNQHRRYLESRLTSNENTIESYMTVTNEYQFDDIDMKLYIGEGSYGGDGFILAESVSTQQFLWLISFDESNPFVSLKRIDDTILIENNLYEVWEINIKDIHKPILSIIQQSKYLH